MKKDVSTKELMELMKAGKLLAKDILPLLGKEFADMARQGGALKYALNSLNSVQGRLNKSFKDFVSSIYQGGLLDGLRDLYKTLDQLFYYMAQGGDSAIGQFLQGFLSQLESSVAFIYNNLLDLYYMLKYDFGFAGADMELLGKATYWIAVVGSLNTILKLMGMIFGGSMIGAITRTTAALTGFGGAAAGAAGAGGAATATAGAVSGAAGLTLGGLMAPLLAVGAANVAYDALGWTRSAGELNKFSTSGNLNTMQQQSINASQPLFLQNAQSKPQDVNVNITMDKNAKELIKAQVDENNRQQLNSMIPPYLKTNP